MTSMQRGLPPSFQCGGNRSAATPRRALTREAVLLRRKFLSMSLVRAAGLLTAPASGPSPEPLGVAIVQEMTPEQRVQLARHTYEEMLVRVRAKSTAWTWNRLRRAAQNLRAALDDLDKREPLGTTA